MATQVIHSPARAIRELAGDRVIGIVGALTAVVATGLSWYAEQVSVIVRGSADHVSSCVTLWHVRNVAAWLIVAGALTGIASLVFWGREAWRTYVAASVAGFGIAVYSLVAIFAVPDLGSAAVVGTRIAAVASSSVDVAVYA